MMEADVQGVPQATTVALQNTMVAGQHTRISLSGKDQQKLGEEAVENQAEDDFESHVDEANKVQIVKNCQTRKCSKLHIRFRLQKSRESMTMES